MTAVRLAAALAAAVLCALPGCMLPMRGDVEQDRAHLTWEPIPVPEDASDMRYEVAVYEAEQGLPVRRVRFVPWLRTPECDTGHLPPGEYVWSVRARYERLGREWVTRWRTMPNAPATAVVPQRGFCPLTIGK